MFVISPNQSVILTLKRMHFYVDSRQHSGSNYVQLINFILYRKPEIFDICYQELFSFACELILLREKCIRFDRRIVKRTSQVTMYSSSERRARFWACLMKAWWAAVWRAFS